MELDPQKDHAAVFFTDGGCRPNPGQIGMGLHGYIYEMDVAPKKKVVIPNNFGEALSYVSPTTIGYMPCSKDGQFESNKNFQILEPLHYIDHNSNSPVSGTNNQAELRAFRTALLVAKECKLKRVHVITDSQYVLNGLHGYIKRDRQEYMDRPPAQNGDLWDALMRAYWEFEDLGGKVVTSWGRGHIGEQGNTCADWLATIAVMRGFDSGYTDRTIYAPARKYWEPEVIRHPFLNFKRNYFNRLMQYNTAGQYYMADPGGVDDHIGKRTPDSGYAVVRLATPDPTMEVVRQRQFEFGQDFNAIMVTRMDRLFSKDVYSYINQYGKYCLLGKDKDDCNLSFLDASPVTVQQYPMGRMVQALDTLSILEDTLDKVTAMKASGEILSTDTTHLRYKDITEHFYETVEKKVGKEIRVSCELKSTFVVGYTMHMLDIEVDTSRGMRKIKVPLTLGIDLPVRNNLKRLEKTSPKVYLITWSESDRSLRYACVLESGQDIGIWSNYFADRILLKD